MAAIMEDQDLNIISSNTQFNTTDETLMMSMRFKNGTTASTLFPCLLQKLVVWFALWCQYFSHKYAYKIPFPTL